MAWDNYKSDCIHLHACRRLVKIYKTNGHSSSVNRHCGDGCCCYQTFVPLDNDLVDAETAYKVAINAARDVAYGYSLDDLMVEIPRFLGDKESGSGYGYILNGLNCDD